MGKSSVHYSLFFPPTSPFFPTNLCALGTSLGVKLLFHDFRGVMHPVLGVLLNQAALYSIIGLLGLTVLQLVKWLVLGFVVCVLWVPSPLICTYP